MSGNRVHVPHQPPESWKDRVKRWLRNPSTRTAAALVALTVCYAAYHKYSSKRRRKAKAITKSSNSYLSASIAPLSLLLTAVENGDLQRALLGSTSVYFQTSGGDNKKTWKRVDLPNSNPDIQKQVLQQVSKLKPGAEISVLPERDWSNVLTGVAAALPFVYLALVYRMLRDQVGGTGDSVTKSLSRTAQQQQIRTTFADVAGLDEAVTEVSEVVQYLRHPAAYRRLGAVTAPRGVLLHGPPGTGKTLLAQAVAGEAAVDSFTACSASDFVECYVGRGAARVRNLFATARRDARRNCQRRNSRVATVQQWLVGMFQPKTVAASAAAVIFIDELDALAKTRAGGLLNGSSNDEREQTLNQLLTEMEGFHKDNNDVTLIVMAATNRADVLDPAVRRRFDRQVRVGYPDLTGRQAILQVHARHIRTCPSVDWVAIAEAVGDNVSGADLRNLVNEAALLAVREGTSNKVVSQRHLEHAARRIRQMKQQWDPELFRLE